MILKSVLLHHFEHIRLPQAIRQIDAIGLLLLIANAIGARNLRGRHGDLAEELLITMVANVEKQLLLHLLG